MNIEWLLFTRSSPPRCPSGITTSVVVCIPTTSNQKRREKKREKKKDSSTLPKLRSDCMAQNDNMTHQLSATIYFYNTSYFGKDIWILDTPAIGGELEWIPTCS